MRKFFCRVVGLAGINFQRMVVEMVGGGDPFGKQEEGEPIMPTLSVLPFLTISPIFLILMVLTVLSGARASDGTARGPGGRGRQRVRASKGE